MHEWRNEGVGVSKRSWLSLFVSFLFLFLFLRSPPFYWLFSSFFTTVFIRTALCTAWHLSRRQQVSACIRNDLWYLFFFFVWELKKKSLADWLMYVYVDAEPILLWKPITKRKKRFGKKTTIATPSEINFSLIYCADCRNGKQQAFIQFFLLSPFFCVIIFFFFFDLNRKR